MDTPFLSVIIPARNEARFLGECLESVLASDYPAGRMEILVIDGESEDATREIARRSSPRVRVIANPERTTPHALNRGIAAARGEVVARVDAHSRIARDYLSGCVRVLLSTGAANVGGSMRTSMRTSSAGEHGPAPWAEAISLALASRFGVGNSRFRTIAEARRGAHAAVASGKDPIVADTVFGGCWRREIFGRLGGFNVRLTRGQDYEFNRRILRAGGKILLVPELETVYFAQHALGDFWRHNWRNGEWAILPWVNVDLRSSGRPVGFRHLVPLGFVLALGTAIAAVGMEPTWWPGITGIGGAYLMTNLAASAGIVRREGKARLLARLPVVFASLHLSYGAGSLWGLAKACAVLLRRRLQKPAATTGDLAI